MALAYLCQQMKIRQRKLNDHRRFRLQAFVINHRARKGSAKEAKLVSERLQDLMSTSSLPVGR